MTLEVGSMHGHGLFQLCRPNEKEKEAVKDEEFLKEHGQGGSRQEAKKPRMAHSWLISAVGTEYSTVYRPLSRQGVRATDRDSRFSILDNATFVDT